MKRIILLIGLLLMCAYAVSETWGDASSRVNFYYQYDGGTTDEPGTYDLLLADRLKALCGHDSIYYNSNTNKYLTGRGCCLFSFAHAYQYLCGYSGSNALKADILYRFLSTKPVWSDTGSSLSPPNAAGIYAQSLAAQPGVNSYGASLSTFSKLKAFFEGRQSVLIMNVPGHYFCAVGCIEHGGVQYVQVIDSTLSGTIRTGRCTQAKSFDFSQTYTPANVLNYAAGVRQYWLPYSEFSSKCRIKYAYRAAKAPAVNPLTADRDELILLAGESMPLNIQGTDRELEYICSDETVASVSDGGVVHALAPGRACVTCRIKGSPGISLDIQLYCISVPEESVCVTDVNGELPILPQIDGELPEGAYAVYENADTSASGVSGAEAAVFTREGYEMLRLSVTVIALDPQTLWQIPGSFAIIESEAFAGMNVSYLAVPAGVMLIEENAFADCPLTAVFVQSRETRIASDAFGGAYVTYAYDEYLKWADKR